MIKDCGDAPNVPTQQGDLHFGRVAFERVHVRERAGIEAGQPGNLLLDDRIGSPRPSRERNHQRRFELVEDIAPNSQRIDDDPLLRQELDVVQPAKCCGIRRRYGRYLRRGRVDGTSREGRARRGCAKRRAMDCNEGRVGRWSLTLLTKIKANGAQGRNRTTDTAIFSRMLYQLSYLGAECWYKSSELPAKPGRPAECRAL